MSTRPAPPDLFLTADPASTAALRRATSAVVDAVERWATAGGPWSGADPTELARRVSALDPCPEVGAPLTTVAAAVTLGSSCAMPMTNGSSAEARRAAHVASRSNTGRTCS